MSEAAVQNGRAPAAGPLRELAESVRRQAAAGPVAFNALVHDFLGHARGVIHVGAHVGQERGVYGDRPVAWVEAVPLVYEALCEQIAGYPGQTAHNYLIADGKTHRLNLASNACQSSSIFGLKLHRELWPEVGYVGSAEFPSITLAEFVGRHVADPDLFDTLVLDVQGAELLVLQGAGECLKRFRWVMAEAADFEAYEGGCQLKDLDGFLEARGFARQKICHGPKKEGVGQYYEVLYRNTLEGIPAAAGAPDGAVRLDIGGGQVARPGYVTVDRKNGQEAYPLPHADGSVDEILASHVLEHFSHMEVSIVLREWVRALRPGGRIRLAVPDFEAVARDYLAGLPINVQGYVMGGHVDVNDRHGCLFDSESLAELMMRCGLERIARWAGDPADCSGLPISLNLQGFKPGGPQRTLEGVFACMSVPRFGPLMHPRCVEKALSRLRVEVKAASSCYWHQQLSVLMEECLAEPGCGFVLTMDYDTVFGAADVLELYRLLQACPEADAVFPVQSKRGCTTALFSLPGPGGKPRATVTQADLTRNLLEANTGHFGLTLFRAESLRKFARPWMVPAPNAGGRWDDGQTDADIDFWRRFRAAGFRCFVAPRVVVGHLEEVIKWPGKDLRPVYQGAADYDRSGAPPEVAR